MAIAQSTYPLNPPKGIHGAIASEEKCNKISRTVENSGGIYFGTPVSRGTGDHGVIPMAAGVCLGIAVLNPAVPAVATGSTLIDGYPQYFTGAFMTMGTMYVTAGANVADGAEVFYNTVTRRYVSAAGTNIVGPVPGAFFESTGVNGDIVEISLGLRPVTPAA